jgi:hypothetical protein
MNVADETSNHEFRFYCEIYRPIVQIKELTLDQMLEVAANMI